MIIIVYFHLLKLIFKTLITLWLTTISTTWINFILIVKLKPIIVKPNNIYFNGIKIMYGTIDINKNISLVDK